jgi:hypothetical protein
MGCRTSEVWVGEEAQAQAPEYQAREYQAREYQAYYKTRTDKIQAISSEIAASVS